MNDLKTNHFKFTNDKSLKLILKSYLEFKKIDSNWNYINSCSNLDLTNQLSMICPFSNHEKQMLLEARSLEDRYILLLSILENTVKLNDEKTKSYINVNQNLDELLAILICLKLDQNYILIKKKMS